MEWQWHELDHMQIICTSLQTDNHDGTSSLNFLQACIGGGTYWAGRATPLFVHNGQALQLFCFEIDFSSISY